MNPPAISIRRATPEDAAILAQLARQTFIETYDAYYEGDNVAIHCDKSFGLAQQLAEINDPDFVVLLAYLEQELIGFAQVVKRQPPECVQVENPISIHRYYVKKEWHGKGIAQPLLASALAAAQELGGKHVWLCMWARNQRALAFYEKVGFQQVGEMEYHFGELVEIDQVLMKAL
jgi:ribosomal protein S18 acetylase RimI-like enzyme